VQRTTGGQQDAAEQLRRLQAVTDAALAHLDLDRLLDELLTRIRDALQADTCAFLLLDPSGTELVARAARGIEEEVEQGVRLPVGRGFAGRVAATRRPVVIDDIDHSEVLNPILREKGIKSLAGAPLIAHGETLGVVHVGTLTPRLFTPEDVELLEVVAQRAAIAIDRALTHEALLHLTEVQRDFVAFAAHELRTPATTVYGLAMTLARRTDLPPETIEELRETLYLQADRMRMLVEQLLDLSRLDAASLRLSLERVTLADELEGIVKAVAPGREKDVTITTPGTTDVMVDRTVIERVVTNLLTNALDYGAPPIRVLGRLTDRHLRIVVEDSGEGIDPQFVPHLFDRFRRSEESSGKRTGAGLGLSIARSYARAHGGELLYDPAGGAGARFELVLPALLPEE
jgi:signal transduction histidine kinase